MNVISKTKERWWQIFVFAQEAYLALMGLTFSVLAARRLDVEGPAADYMLLGYFAAIIGLFFSGVVLIKFGKTKTGWIALAVAVGAAFAFVVLILPVLAHGKRHA